MLGFLGLLLGIFFGQLAINLMNVGFSFWSFVIQLVFIMAFTSIFAAISENIKR